MTPDWREDSNISEQTKEAGRIGGGLLLVLIGIWIGSWLFAGDSPLISDTGYYTNIFTEILSVTLTIGVLNYLAERRNNKRRLDERKRDLIREAGSQDNATAVNAIAELWDRGWIRGENGILQGTLLAKANLSDVRLWGANLSGAFLGNANLEHAYVGNATFDENTTLPDGRKWTPNIDWSRHASVCSQI